MIPMSSVVDLSLAYFANDVHVLLSCCPNVQVKPFSPAFCSQMLCEKCSNIAFRRFPAGFCPPGVNRSYEEHLFYAHHNSKSALRASKDECHLCRKMWNSFENQTNGAFGRDVGPSDASPVNLFVWLRDKWISNGLAEKHLYGSQTHSCNTPFARAKPCKATLFLTMNVTTPLSVTLTGFWLMFAYPSLWDTSQTLLVA
jgi:hypothetical protein